MKASFASSLSVLRGLAAPAAALLLCQCSMPSREAWQYIQSNGLLTYLGSGAQRSSPPFRAGHSGAQYPIASQRGFYSPRSPAMSSYYAAAPRQPRAPYQPNRYYSAPSQDSGVIYDRRPSPVRPRPAPSAPPRERIAVEEPSSAPQIVKNDPASSTSPSPAPNISPPATADLPYGTAVPGRANMVNSPYAGKTQLVDVSGMGTGQTVKCPYTGKLFKVPPQQQAANSTAPQLEAKIETPKLDSEPKAEDKKP